MNNRIYHGHCARKRFGQNFLNDMHIIKYIVDAIHPQQGEVIVEIGPGLGALTKPISKHLDSMVVIELDRDLVTRLQANRLLSQKLIVYQQDAMTFDFSKLALKSNQAIRIVGNLPYNISTPLIFYLFNYINSIKDMHFMLQKEIVNRIVAKPNSKSYSRLSVMIQYYCHVIPILEVPMESFIPVPKVNSIFLRLVPHKIRPYQVDDIRMLNLVTTKAFCKRRKTIHNSLKYLFSIEIIEKLGIDSRLRAENISVAQYCQLANWLTICHKH